MIKFTIPLPPITKKNSQQIRYRYTHDKKTGNPKRAPYIAQSEAYTDYEAAALWFIPKGQTINKPVNVKCVFYMPTKRKVDKSNLEAAAHDIFVAAGLLADDNRDIIASTDGSRVFYDKDNPRTEVEITYIDNYEVWKK